MIVIKRLISPVVGRAITQLTTPLTMPRYSFALMALFEQPKKPAELSPVFQKPKRIKGHLRSKHRKGYVSPKLNTHTKVREKMRLKNHKGMLKRVKIVSV